MMSHLFRCTWSLYLLVALTSAPANSSDLEKLGRCPRETLDKKLCSGQVDQCGNSSQCSGDSICCSTGCNKVCLLPSFTACDHSSQFYKNQVKLLSPEEALDVIVPKCTKSGSFEEIQCNEKKGLCWCVDSFGFEKGGTRANSREAVNCTRSNARCSGPQCRMLCPYGFELDSDGCEMCLCKDICKGVKCPGSLECQLQEVSCATEPCPPVPTCKKPRTLESLCQIGTPFTIPETGNPFLCGVTPGKPSCPPGFNCNVNPGDDYGVCCGSESFYEKPGLCPTVSGTRSTCDDSPENQCHSSCNHDLECPEMKKCCMTEGSGKQCTDALNSTLCLQQKKIAEILSTKEIEGRGYVPQCDSNGNFLRTQCSRNGKICWCVDATGRNVPQSLAPAHLLNCSILPSPRRGDLVRGSTTTEAACDINLCANTCEFGYATDEVTGCGTCDCIVDPCQNVKCPLGTKCSLAVSTECQGPALCQMQPTCLSNVLNVNPCDNGPPLLDHSSNQLVVCSENGATCPSSHVCVKASVNTDGLCCLNIPRLESTKAGMCPFISSSHCNGTESESRLCNSDKDCEGDMKCCATACGAICADPSLDAQTESNKLPTMCQYLESVQMKQTDVLKNFKLALTTPKCKSSGEFDEIQCSEGYCFCADEFGIEIASTRVPEANNLTSEFCMEKRRLPSCLDMTCRLGCDYGYKTKDNCRICECVDPCEQNTRCDEDHYCEMVDIDCSEGYCPAVPYCIPRIYAAIALSQQFPRDGICPNGAPYFDKELNASLTCRPRARMLQCPDDYFCHEFDENHDFGQCCPILELAEGSLHGETRESDFPVVSSGNILEDFPIHRKTSLTDCELSRNRQMELTLQNQRVNYIPRCNAASGAWEQVQCIEEVNMCWCVNTAGTTIPGSITSGKPICNFRQSRGKFLGSPSQDQPVCSDNQSVHVCSKSLCDGKLCLANPQATCQIDPCGGCRVRFYDQNNNVIDCEAGLGKCQKDAQNIMNSRTWINQQKQSGHSSDEDEFPGSLDRIIDDVLQARLGRAIEGPESSFPTVAELVAEVMKQSQSSLESFGEKVSDFLLRNPSPSPQIPSVAKISAAGPKMLFESSEFVETFSNDGEAGAKHDFAAIPMLMRKGSCPQPSPNEILFRLTGTCLDLCNYDDECGHDERCCLVDCGYRCKKVTVELQVKVVEQKGRESLASFLGNDFEESKMLLNPPTCRSNGEYERRQVQGDLKWCVNAQGHPHLESFTRGHLLCSEEGKMVQQKSTQRICENSERSPMICSDQCLKSSCKSHPEAICVADPCDACSVTFFTPSGDKVHCEDKCEQPVDPGLCRASFERYFYNKTSKMCEEFSWGGCVGNSNNFETLEDCKSSCGSEIDICSLPLFINTTCLENLERWFFDTESETCQKFVGCAESGVNNFPSLKHCESRCPLRVLCPNIVEGGLSICNRADACRKLTQNCSNLSSDNYICSVEPCSCLAEITSPDGRSIQCEIAENEQVTADSTEAENVAELLAKDEPRARSFEIEEELLPTSPLNKNVPAKESLSSENGAGLLVVRPGFQDTKPRCYMMKEKYLSKCDEHWNFVPTQCSADEPVCWCVDSIGNQLEGTSTFLAGSTICPTVSVQSFNVRLSFPVSRSEDVSPAQLGTEIQDLLRSLQAQVADNKVSVEGVDGFMNVDFTLEGESSGQVSHLLEEGLRRSLLGISVQNHLTLADLSYSRFHYVVPEVMGVGSDAEETTTSSLEDASEAAADALDDVDVKQYYVGTRADDDGVTAKEVRRNSEEMNVVAIVLTVIAAITAVLIIIGLFLGLQNKKTVSNYPKNKFRPIAFSSPFEITKKEFDSLKI